MWSLIGSLINVEIIQRLIDMSIDDSQDLNDNCILSNIIMKETL